jgi:hypothetical protein
MAEPSRAPMRSTFVVAQQTARRLRGNSATHQFADFG